MTCAALRRELKAAGTPERAVGAARFFKTGKGDYGEGDIFLGVTVPLQRKIALRYKNLALDEAQQLLTAREHECRAAALEILVMQHRTGDDKLRKSILRLYLANMQFINNWALVDMSAGEIVGGHQTDGATELLLKLARSKSLWERRIAMIATLPLARRAEVASALIVAERLLDDRHDLIHKAVGWVLRVVGDVNRPALLGFLKEHYARIPRTALRYAIEHFPPHKRKQMLAGKFAA